MEWLIYTSQEVGCGTWLMCRERRVLFLCGCHDPEDVMRQIDPTAAFTVTELD